VIRKPRERGGHSPSWAAETKIIIIIIIIIIVPIGYKAEERINFLVKLIMRSLLCSVSFGVRCDERIIMCGKYNMDTFWYSYISNEWAG
jgi:hypothetical protein